MSHSPIASQPAAQANKFLHENLPEHELTAQHPTWR